MAAAATATTLAWHALSGLFTLLGAGVALLLVAPSAFLAGVLVWRHVPERFLGAVGGLLATVGTYLISGVAVGLGLAASAVLAAPPGYFGGLVQSVLIYLFMLVVAVVYTGWVAVPAGVAAGWLYERSRPAGA